MEELSCVRNGMRGEVRRCVRGCVRGWGRWWVDGMWEDGLGRYVDIIGRVW